MKRAVISSLLMLAVSSGAWAASQTESQGGGSEPIVAATFNLRYDNSGDGDNAWPNRAEWVKQLVRFHEWDVFGTEEGLRRQLDDLAGMSEYNWVGVGRDDGVSAGEHSAIFYRKSRFELLDKGNFWLSETPDRPSLGWDAPSNIRICSWAKLRDMHTDKEFFFFCVHYDHIGRTARVESSKLILEKMRAIAGSSPAILVGDMNSTPDSEAIAVLDAGLRDSYKVTLQPPYGPVGTFHAFNWDREVGGNRIDYIFCTKGIEVMKYGVLSDSKNKRYPSDHFPVMVKLRLE